MHFIVCILDRALVMQIDFYYSNIDQSELNSPEADSLLANQIDCYVFIHWNYFFYRRLIQNYFIGEIRLIVRPARLGFLPITLVRVNPPQKLNVPVYKGDA